MKKQTIETGFICRRCGKEHLKFYAVKFFDKWGHPITLETAYRNDMEALPICNSCIEKEGWLK